MSMAWVPQEEAIFNSGKSWVLIVFNMARRLHVNPLKPRVMMVHNEDSGEMKEVEEPMPLRDAAFIAAILTIWQIFVVFLIVWDWSTIQADFAAFCFELFVFSGATFMGFLVVLAGLARWAVSRRR